RVRLHRLVDVKRGEALDIEAGQPHGAYDGHPEWMLRGLEGYLNIHPLVSNLEALLHPGAMRDDVEVPLLKIGNLILCFADDDPDNRLFHPFRLTAKEFKFFRESVPLPIIGSYSQLHLLLFDKRLDCC